MADKIISINNLSDEIVKELQKYGLSIATGVKDVTDKVTKEFVKDTSADAPRGARNKYHKNITSRTKTETPNAKTNEWYVKSPEYRLTHLIVKGHKVANSKKGKSQTKAQDFITPNLKEAEENLENEIMKVINNGY